MKNTSNRVLIILGAFLLVFIACMIVTFWRFQTVPDTLIQCVMGAGSVEAAALAWIKATKVKSGSISKTETIEESEEEQ